MPKSEILIATGNAGKLAEVRGVLEENGLRGTSPADAGIEVEVEETGETLEENALLKAKAFQSVVSEPYIVLADDSGLEIEALDGEPGIKVRRWKDGVTEMSDQEIVDYALERLENVPTGNRGGRFRSVVALLLPDGTNETFDGYLSGQVLEEQAGEPPKGFPFRCLFLVDSTGKMLGEHDGATGRTHREQAVQKAVDWLKDYNK